MENKYVGYTFTIDPKELGTEILIAQLGMVNFESFVETEEGVQAYIQEEDWTEDILSNIQVLSSDEFDISYKQEVIEQVNWNSEWEKNFEQIEVDGKVSIRAPFHENPNLEFDIVIEPKMSFGTGHHETTHMMIQQLLDMDLEGKKTLDMGCGTGILAIFAEMRGAQPIDAIDIDNWCYENTVENAERNGCKHISSYEGDGAMCCSHLKSISKAYINRNILLNDMQTYMECLNDGGVILFSGFYKEDIPIMDETVSKYGLKLDRTIERNNWVSLRYIK